MKMLISTKWLLPLATFLVAYQFPAVASLGFTPGLEYWYSLQATTFIKDAGTIHTSAKIGIAPLNTTGAQNAAQHQPPFQLCRLMVEDYDIDISQLSQTQEPERPDLDFNKCLLFDLTEDGEVQTIYYEQTEVPAVLSAKKTILNLMSSKLVISRSQVEKGQRWGYATNETGHEGTHSAVYQAEPSTTKVNFVKTKTTKAMESAKHQQIKKITVHRKSHVPQEFHSQDEFSTLEDSLFEYGLVSIF